MSSNFEAWIRPQRTRWALLVTTSVLLAATFESLHVPSAFLIAPILASAALAAHGAPCILPGPIFRIAHAVIGTVIARALPTNILADLKEQWPLFVLGVALVVLASSFLGWALARARVLPGTTAVWGSAPGAATAMVVMSAGFGADPRLVAFMQYLRVVCVVLVATLVARIWVVSSTDAGHGTDWLAPVPFWSIVETLLLVTGGAQLGHSLKIPAGALLTPLVLGAILSGTGLLTIVTPPWLLVPAYVLVGWQIGCRFDRAILLAAAKAFPRILISTLALIGTCGLFAAGLTAFAGIDPLTAYLATSPGGIDSVAIIGMAGKADMPFVMAMQAARLVVVMATGPWIARAIATQVEKALAGKP